VAIYTVKGLATYGQQVVLSRVANSIVANVQGRIFDQMLRMNDTPCGEHGMQLSGGQRQRIAIARAFLKDAPIILLDEATSALDSESEQAIQKALHTLCAGRTTLVIAHRLSTVAQADEICVIDRGRVVERGRHGELLAQGRTYSHIAQTQFPRDAA
jgi:ABC-type multidrug transport system fused ATPase/permease subunit